MTIVVHCVLVNLHNILCEVTDATFESNATIIILDNVASAIM